MEACIQLQYVQTCKPSTNRVICSIRPLLISSTCRFRWRTEVGDAPTITFSRQPRDIKIQEAKGLQQTRIRWVTKQVTKIACGS
uniref:Uncharacterized protein n=1 Tax=Anguilla anguilla TaxID=7936 RepID=A0A0E9WML6_ANGAN